MSQQQRVSGRRWLVALVGAGMIASGFYAWRLSQPRAYTREELTAAYRSLVAEASSVSRCKQTRLVGEPSQICTTNGACSASTTLNTWISEQFATPSNRLANLDPAMVKAIIAQESLSHGRIISRATTVQAADGTAATSAYGVGQFVSGTLYEQLQAVEKQFNQSMPDACRELTGSSLAVPTTCRQWLDQIPTTDQHVPTGVRLQVYLVVNYLAQLATTDCVQGNVGRAAMAYYLGPGDMQYLCALDSWSSLPEATAARLARRLSSVQKYVHGFRRYYQAYCSASQ